MSPGFILIYSLYEKYEALQMKLAKYGRQYDILVASKKMQT